MLKRFPAGQDVVPVYAVISFLLYGWTTILFFWKLPSWLLSLTVGEIVSIFAYSMVVDFFESIFYLALFLLVAAVLPPDAMRNRFVVRGTWLAFSVIGSMMLGLWLYASNQPLVVDNIVYWLAGFVLLSLLMPYFAGRLGLLQKIALWVSDRLIIFLFVTVPLSLTAILVVAFRNVF